MTEKFHLSEKMREILLRDTGYAPKDSNPDGHFRRETPPLQGRSLRQEKPTIDSKQSK